MHDEKTLTGHRCGAALDGHPGVARATARVASRCPRAGRDHRADRRAWSSMQQKQPVAGASVIAIHEPSGTSYEATTRADGRFFIPNMRVGGPYTVTVAYTGTGAAAFEPQTRCRRHGQPRRRARICRSRCAPIAVQETVTVTAQSDTVFSSARTGAATSVEPRGNRHAAHRSPAASTTSRASRRRPAAMSFARPGQSTEQHHGRRFVLQQLVRPGGRARRAHRRRADFARSDRADSGQRRAVRRAPGQFRRRWRQHRDAQRHQSIHRLVLSPIPQRGLRRHRSEGAAVQSRDVQLPQHRRLGGRADRSRTGCLPSAPTRTKTIAGRSRSSRANTGRRACRRQHDTRAGLRPDLAQRVSRAAASITRPAASRSSTT